MKRSESKYTPVPGRRYAPAKIFGGAKLVSVHPSIHYRENLDFTPAGIRFAFSYRRTQKAIAGMKRNSNLAALAKSVDCAQTQKIRHLQNQIGFLNCLVILNKLLIPPGRLNEKFCAFLTGRSSC